MPKGSSSRLTECTQADDDDDDNEDDGDNEGYRQNFDYINTVLDILIPQGGHETALRSNFEELCASTYIQYRPNVS